MKTVISATNVCKSFSTGKGLSHVLKDVNFSVYENEFVVLFGPGQCGKTTLLNIIAGLDTPTSGQVAVDNL